MGGAESRKAGLGRRGLVRLLAIAGVVLALVAVASIAGGWWKIGGRLGGPKAAGPEVRAYFGELHDGTTTDGFTLVRIYDINLGAIPIVMATKDGTHFQVDLLRRDPNGPGGVGTTNELSLFVSNSGDGGTQTAESQGLAVQALAGALRQRETEGAKPPPLSTMNERLSANAQRNFGVPLD